MNWVERENFKFDAEDDRRGRAHRRFTVFDAIRIALVERLTRFGIEISYAGDLAHTIINHMMVGAKGDVQTGVQIFMYSKVILWFTPDDEGGRWNYIIGGKTEHSSDAYIVIDFGMIARDVIERWKTLAAKEFEIEREKYK